MAATATDWTGQGIETDVVNKEGVGEITTYEPRWSKEVVSHEGDMVRIRQKLMVVGQPYGFIYDGVPTVAIKRESESVDFYHVPVK